MTIIRVQQIVPVEGQPYKTFKEAFVEIPTALFESAQKEKEGCRGLSNYVWMFDRGHLHAHYEIARLAQSLIGGPIDWRDIERINVHRRP